MTADDCHRRASACAENAALASSDGVAQEFLKLAAQWRAMASRQIFLGHIDGPGDPLGLSDVTIMLPS